MEDHCNACEPLKGVYKKTEWSEEERTALLKQEQYPVKSPLDYQC